MEDGEGEERAAKMSMGGVGREDEFKLISEMLMVYIWWRSKR